MSISNMGSLQAMPVSKRMDLVAIPAADALKNIPPLTIREIYVSEIDPTFADTAAFCKRYGVGLEKSANCVIVQARRGASRWLVACMVLATTRADINGLVRRHLGARSVSFAPMDMAVTQTGMEYGGITPIGLPADWPILIDAAVAASEAVIIGSGLRQSKLLVPGKLLANLQNATVLNDLGNK